MSTLWPLLDRVGGSKAFLGYLVSAFSFGQLIGSPYFGYWANHWRYKYIFFISGMLKVVGNLMYAFSDSVSGRADFFMLEARLLVGLGAGNMALCNAYVSQVTTMKERTQSMAMLAASGGVGFIIGPLIGVSFGSMKPGYDVGPLVIDYLTMPALCCCILESINQLFILIFFREPRIIHRSPSTSSSADSIQLESMSRANLKTDMPAAWILMLQYFGTMVVLSVFETVGTPLTMDEYSLNSQQADIYNGVIAGAFGLICVVMFGLVKKLATKFGERQLLLFSLFLTALSMAALIPIAGSSPDSWKENDEDDDSTRHGCQATWCGSVPKLPFAQYCVGCVLVAIAYPMANVMEFSLFSKILGPFPQGVMMGWLTAAGCLARALGPLYITQLYAEFGPRITFAVATGIALVMALIASWYYKRFVPHPLHVLNEANEQQGQHSPTKTKSVMIH